MAVVRLLAVAFVLTIAISVNAEFYSAYTRGAFELHAASVGFIATLNAAFFIVMVYVCRQR